MKLAFSRPTLDAAEQRALFSRFRAAGFDGLQLKAGQYAPYVGEPHRFQSEWGRDPGAVSALIWAGGLDEEGVAALRQVLAFAAQVGAERVVFCHALSREGLEPAAVQGFGRLLAHLANESRQEGVRLSLHHHDGQPVMRRPDFDLFFDAAGTETVGLTIDTAHLVQSGIADIAGLIRDFRAVIDNVHLKDFAGGQFRVLGEGEIDFVPVLAALREIGYDGWLCADEESGAGIEPGLAASHRFLRTQLARRPS